MASLSAKIKNLIIAIFVGVFVFTPVFQAQAFGPTVIIGNIPDAIQHAVEEALTSSFLAFAQNYTKELIQKIENNYKIANFLYYTDALVTGQYLQDYLNKYVTEPFDQRMVMAFVPQVTCGNKVDIAAELRQQARNYLGYDPTQLQTNDPDFYLKLARMGDFYSSPAGWEQHYEDLAKKAASEAKAAAQAEITSPGVKTGRLEVGAEGVTIATTVNSLIQNQSAAIQASLDLGTVHVDQIAGTLARNTIYKFVNSFAFKGAVLKEQGTCVSTPTLEPIIPIGDQPDATALERSFLFVDPEFVTPDNNIFLTAKVNINWDLNSLKSKGAVKARLNKQNDWLGLSGGDEVQITFSGGSDYSSFDCYKFVMDVYNDKDQVIQTDPIVAYVFNKKGKGPSASNTFCGGTGGGSQQPRS